MIRTTKALSSTRSPKSLIVGQNILGKVFSRQKKKTTPTPKIFKKKLKELVLYRDNYTCQHCGVNLFLITRHLDRIFPGALGGKYTYDNTQASCEPCNERKSDTYPYPTGHLYPHPSFPI